MTNNLNVLEKDVTIEEEDKDQDEALDIKYEPTSFYPRATRYNLDFDETITLIKKAQDGDKMAIDMLVQDNIGLVWSSVSKFTNRGIEADDLFQIGAIGLIKCIKKFDTSFDVKFST